MRLIKPNNGSWKALFTVAWEVEHLAEVGDQWVSFALPQVPLFRGCSCPLQEALNQEGITSCLLLIPCAVLCNQAVYA